MRKVRRAALAASLLACAAPAAMAQTDSHWLTDPDSRCAVFDANANEGDVVYWSGACVDGLASGEGTAAFSNHGKSFESFEGTFSKGVAQDGHVVVRWGNGWVYDGNNEHGQFNGPGVLTNDKQDRFEGNWVDGRMNGHGTLIRASGERYDGEWKDDLPDGPGLLQRADGTTAKGIFAQGKLVRAEIDAPPDTEPAPKPEIAAEVPAPTPQAQTPKTQAVVDAPAPAPAKEANVPTAPVKTQAVAESKPAPAAAKHAALEKSAAKPARAPGGFDSMAGKTLSGIDGSQIALSPIEGGIERQITPAGGAPQKTTFTFMNDRLGTVVEDGGPAAGANVTGFFRLTDTGVEVRYADGRSENLSSRDDGGVLMTLTSPTGEASCRAWYPQGHVFSEDEKKAALAAYASKLGLAATPVKPSGACPGKAAAVSAPAPAAPPASTAKRSVKTPAAHTAFHPERGKISELQPVAVRESVVHTIDPMAGADLLPGQAALPGPLVANVPPGQRDASACLKVESDGTNWGFRNACGFAVQFSYCQMHGGVRLTDCGSGDAVNSVSGSVAASGFGALSLDNSIAEKNVDHDYRWVACDGGAGEVVAHLDHAEPPSGHCDRADTVTASTH